MKDIITKKEQSNTESLSQQNKITNSHLCNLDNFIQNCLNKFKFIDPKQEFYDATGEDQDLIISHKSTIPDLVIWNKKFNKNDCFLGANTSKKNLFPRLQYVLRIKSNKSDKERKKDKKLEREKNKKDKLTFN